METQRPDSMRPTLNHCVTSGKSLHLSALSVLLPGYLSELPRRPVKGGRLSRGSLKGRCYESHHWQGGRGIPPWWHFLRQLGEQEWGWAISGLQVLGTNPFLVTTALKAKLKQIFLFKKKIELIKAHIPWDERIVAFLIVSPPARSPCRHNSSLAAPPVTKIMKPTKRERKKQAEHQAGTIVCSEQQPRLWVAAGSELFLERAWWCGRQSPLSRLGFREAPSTQILWPSVS